MVVIAYHLLTGATTYADLGSAYFEQRGRDAVRRRLVGGLEQLGCEVTTEPIVA